MRREQVEAVAAGIAVMAVPVALVAIVVIRLLDHRHPPATITGYDSGDYYADNP